MLKNIKKVAAVMLVASIAIIGCEKEKYAFGDIKTPSNLSLAATIEGTDAANPNGNGTGNVAINLKADNAITYKVTFGDNDSLMTQAGSITHKYRSPGVNTYTITV